MNKKLITIITVCRNSEHTIQKCIESILPVIGEDTEYIIKDGNSTDKTKDIAKVLCKNNNNVNFLSKNDNGIYDAMNKAIEMASGEYIWFVNSDDTIKTKNFDDIKRYLSLNPWVDCLYGDCDVVENTNGTDERIKTWKGSQNLTELRKGMICSHQAILCRTELIKSLGGFNTKLKIAADWDLILRLYNHGAKFKYLPIIIANFSRGGISCKRTHILERHLVRKWNHCYNGIIDQELVRDIKTLFHDIIYKY